VNTREGRCDTCPAAVARGIEGSRLRAKAPTQDEMSRPDLATNVRHMSVRSRYGVTAVLGARTAACGHARLDVERHELSLAAQGCLEYRSTLPPGAWATN
jgi:hypothetical protein